MTKLLLLRKGGIDDFLLIISKMNVSLNNSVNWHIRHFVCIPGINVFGLGVSLGLDLRVRVGIGLVAASAEFAGNRSQLHKKLIIVIFSWKSKSMPNCSTRLDCGVPNYT